VSILSAMVLGLAGDEEAAGELKKEVMEAFALGFLASDAARSTALRLRDMMKMDRGRERRKDTLERNNDMSMEI